MKLDPAHTTVLDLACSSKEAALYFDYVIPCYLMVSGGPFTLEMDSIPCKDKGNRPAHSCRLLGLYLPLKRLAL